MRLLHNTDTLDAPRGFEPRLTESESVVLPLDDGAVRSPGSGAGEIEIWDRQCQRREDIPFRNLPYCPNAAYIQIKSAV